MFSLDHIPSKTALVVVDLQNDFCEGGNLPVIGGNAIAPTVKIIADAFNRLAEGHLVLTQDWHPAGHSSFASSHEGAAPFSEIQASYGPQTLWPAHCEQGTKGADFHPELKAEELTNALVVRKGDNKMVDSYSAVLENDKKSSPLLTYKTPAELAREVAMGIFKTPGVRSVVDHFRALGVEHILLDGLATDFCVAFSALDFRAAGFRVSVIMNASAGIGMPLNDRTSGTTMTQRLAQFKEKGVNMVNFDHNSRSFVPA